MEANYLFRKCVFICRSFNSFPQTRKPTFRLLFFLATPTEPGKCRLHYRELENRKCFIQKPPHSHFFCLRRFDQVNIRRLDSKQALFGCCCCVRPLLFSCSPHFQTHLLRKTYMCLFRKHEPASRTGRRDV